MTITPPTTSDATSARRAVSRILPSVSPQADERKRPEALRRSRPAPREHLHTLPPALAARDVEDEPRLRLSRQVVGGRLPHLVPVRVVDDEQRLARQVGLDELEAPELRLVIVGRVVVVDADASPLECAFLEELERVPRQDRGALEPEPLKDAWSPSGVASSNEKSSMATNSPSFPSIAETRLVPRYEPTST